MRPTKELPDSHVHYEAFTPRALRKAAGLLYVSCILLFAAAYVLFNALARVLRPDFEGRLTFRPSFDPVRSVAMLVALLAFLAVHEAIHGAILWFLTRERPTFRVSIWGAQVEAPTWYLPRNVLLVASLPPVCLLTLAGPVLLLLAPQGLVGLVVLLLAANAGGSAFDLAGSFFVCLLPASSYLSTRGAIYTERPLRTPAGQESRSGWKARLRLYLEQVVSRSDW